MVIDRFIVMDDVSGLANKSEIFSNFLTVSRKYEVFVLICFSYYLFKQTKLGNDNVSNTHI